MIALRIIDVFMISLTSWCEIRIRDRRQAGKLEDYFTENVDLNTKSGDIPKMELFDHPKCRETTVNIGESGLLCGCAQAPGIRIHL
jgi:hypothetical protein